MSKNNNQFDTIFHETFPSLERWRRVHHSIPFPSRRRQGKPV